VQRPLTSGHRGWPTSQTPWPVDPTLQPLMGRLHGDPLQEAVTGDLKPKVSGGWTLWPLGRVAGPANQHLASY
jgi:hypothetical protein